MNEDATTVGDLNKSLLLLSLYVADARPRPREGCYSEKKFSAFFFNCTTTFFSWRSIFRKNFREKQKTRQKAFPNIQEQFVSTWFF